jgi:type I restriction enzyme, R subunit
VPPRPRRASRGSCCSHINRCRRWTRLIGCEGRPDAAQVPGPAAGRDHQARHHRRAAPRAQARPASLDLFYGTPSPGNAKAAERYAANRFSVTRQLRYSRDETQRALDLCLFINGLPVATFELKNSLTKQTVEDAVEQYKRDRDPREKLFEFGRCVVHFAVDDHEVRFCTHLKGKGSWFLPFNKGWNDGAGNPPNPDGLKTDYLWKRSSPARADRHPRELRAGRRDEGREDRQEEAQADLAALPPARRGARLLADVRREHGAGRRYLIQHSAGSGKSNSIAWLAHQLIGLKRTRRPVFDSIIVVTDRASSTSRSGHHQAVRMQVGATVGHAERSGDLRKFIAEGKKIIISTVQKFPFILDEIGSEHRGRRFAIVIDEAHSSQGGKTSAAMSRRSRRGRGAEEDDETGRGHDQPADGGEEAAAQRQLLRLHRHAQEQDAGDLRRARRPRPTARSSTGPSTATR